MVESKEERWRFGERWSGERELYLSHGLQELEIQGGIPKGSVWGTTINLASESHSFIPWFIRGTNVS